MRSLISHLRHTIRLLVRTPGFTIMAILIFGLGIGANTAIFSLVNGVLLKPLPYPHPERLVQVFQPFRNFDQVDLSYPDYVDFSANQHSFDTMTAFLRDDFNLSSRGEAERISGLCVTGDFFRMLGRPFLIGRPFGEAEEKPDAPGVVVISEHLWRTRFHSDRSLIGEDLSLNGKRFQVVGVTPAQANEAAQVELYVPLGQDPRFGTLLTTNRGNHNFVCIARLKEGVELRSAQADLEHRSGALPPNRRSSLRRVRDRLCVYRSEHIDPWFCLCAGLPASGAPGYPHRSAYGAQGIESRS